MARVGITHVWLGRRALTLSCTCNPTFLIVHGAPSRGFYQSSSDRSASCDTMAPIHIFGPLITVATYVPYAGRQGSVAHLVFEGRGQCPVLSLWSGEGP